MFWPAVVLATFFVVLPSKDASPEPKFFSKSMSPVAEMEMVSDTAAPFALRSQSVSGSRRGGVVQPAFADFSPEQANRKIIRDAALDLEVADTELAREEAEKIIADFEGFITNLQSFETRPNVLSFQMTVRVPAENLDKIISALTEIGTKTSENFTSSDITSQYADTDAQIKNLELRRERLRKLLEFETKNLADVLSVDRELSNLQTQLDRLSRTQKGRDERVAYSTLRLALNAEIEIGDLQNPHWSATKSWRGAVNDLIAQLQNLFDLVVKLLVFAPIWAPILVAAYFGRRQWQKRKK